MSIADAQARRLVSDLLTDAVDRVARSEIPFERAGETAWMLLTGGPFTDDETGQTLHPIVYVMISESEAESERITRLLLGTSGGG